MLTSSLRIAGVFTEQVGKWGRSKPILIWYLIKLIFHSYSGFCVYLFVIYTRIYTCIWLGGIHCMYTYDAQKSYQLFSFGGVLHFEYWYGDQFWQPYEKARKVQYTTLKTNHIESVLEQDHINERSNPISQTAYTTTNIYILYNSFLKYYHWSNFCTDLAQYRSLILGG